MELKQGQNTTVYQWLVIKTQCLEWGLNAHYKSDECTKTGWFIIYEKLGYP